MMTDRRGRTLRPEMVQRDRYFEAQLGDPLTPRQFEAARLLCRGLDYKGIARRMGCSARTVERHLHFAYRKAGVRNRVGLVLWWVKVGATA